MISVDFFHTRQGNTNVHTGYSGLNNLNIAGHLNDAVHLQLIIILSLTTNGLIILTTLQSTYNRLSLLVMLFRSLWELNTMGEKN